MEMSFEDAECRVNSSSGEKLKALRKYLEEKSLSYFISS